MTALDVQHRSFRPMTTRTVSTVSSSLGDQLNCAVCLERFADPRTLPCHHSFCLRCLSGAPQEQEEECVLIKCPTCRESSQLPEGGTDQLPTALLINNLLELQDQAEHDQEEESPSCDAHARPLEFYCSTCEALLCSVCTVKKHRTHNCDLASDVIEKCKQQIKQQLDLLEESARKVEAFIEEVDNATEKVQDEGDKTRQEIIAKVDQLHHDLELGKAGLIDMLDQGVQDKMDFLAHLRENVATTLTQMRSSQVLVEESMQRSSELLAAKNELMEHISKACKEGEIDVKFDNAPNAITFSSIPSKMEIGFLIEPDGLHHELKFRTLVAGEKCSFLLHLGITNEDDLVCQLVPSHAVGQAIECQISPLKKGKYQVSFTPYRVGTHNLIIFSASTKKRNIIEIQVNSPFLRGSQRQICKLVLRKPRSVAITKEGQLIVCEEGVDGITVCSTVGEKINTISSSSFKKQSAFKPLCVGVTHDNHIVVIDSGKHQCIQLHKLQLDGKIVNTSTIASGVDVSKFQSPSSVTVHPNGQIFVIDSGSHCIHTFDANLSNFHTFGGKGDAPGQFNQPHSLAFDSSGNGYVSDSMNRRIQKFTMDGDLLNVFGKGDGSEACHLTQPTALCISSYDTIFVADECRRTRIAVFDVQGDLLGEVHYDRISLRNPCAMAVHKNEFYIYVIDSCVDDLQ